jgi:type I restriction enzyme R subunit
MPSNKETLFQEHIAIYLEDRHKYSRLFGNEINDKEFHFIEVHLLDFIKTTQAETYQSLVQNFGIDAPYEIIRALKQEAIRKPLWLIMREGLPVKGFEFQLYYPKPRSTTSEEQEESFKKNRFSFKTEYRYNLITEERIDLVIWLNGLPIVVMELKHEDEGQTAEDAIYESFLTRNLKNNIYKFPFIYVALSNTEAKMATNPAIDKNFRWFNASLQNRAETPGEYPVEHIYRHVLSKENITGYLENFLVFVPAQEKIDENGDLHKTDSFTIFPRYHQFRASKNLAADVKNFVNDNLKLGKKYLINHSAGAGKTLTIAWMADLLDGLYSADNRKVFDNIIILTDRTSLDKNIKDDLRKFAHLATKLNFAERSQDLAKYLEKDRDIIISTIHKFSYIQEKLQNDDILKQRNVAFLIDEAHRSQDGKLAVTMKQFFTTEDDDEEDEDLKKLNLSNQIFVAFTATTTPKTVSYFGEPFDVYSEEEAIAEGYILDVAQNIISYETLYNLQLKEAIPEKDFPHGTISKLLRNIAYEDEEIIQYKAEVIVKYFEERVKNSVSGKGKAMVVASSRLAGLIYFSTIKTILEEKETNYKALFAFSDFTHPKTNQKVNEDELNQLTEEHGGKDIEDVFNLPEYRIMVVANKFQTGFDQPLLSAMFLDKAIKNVNAIQTVSRLNRKHPDKEQEEILVVDFTNNAKEIFSAFNKHRSGFPF